MVYLVGAGPGDPGLLTLRGRQCLQQADVVLYDGLVNTLLLRHTAAHAERTCRSEAPGQRILQQEEINQRLIAAARQGLTVVRLKGGDPFIFGRGSEEAAALRAAGIPFQVVPGVTAATAAGEYAGISLTHRDHASAVALITGHEDPLKEQSAVDYPHLARFQGTLVFYMGLHRLEAIVSSLVAAGRPADEPACVISRASTPLQRTVTAPLAELPAAVRQAGLRAPSLILIGQVVSLRSTIAWYEQRPLFGVRIGITRPIAQTADTADLALELGAQPVLMPTIRIEPPESWQPVDDVIRRLPDFDWLMFTSSNGVDSLLGRLWEQGGDIRSLSHLKLACIGPSTAAALEHWHLRADVVPGEYRAEALAAELAPLVEGRKVLWARASRGRDVLPVELRAAGAHVELTTVYQNLDVEPDTIPDPGTHHPSAAIEQNLVDWIGLSSPSIARNLDALLSPAAREKLGREVQLVAISPVTAAAAEECGLPVAAVATEFTWDGMFQAVIEHRNRS
ncbi:MAG: uroporphyrinogen-III C-methyltransferase [Planctomycetaceae bacterium]|nr:uroporphyrinogen-III C-methyltransferase [Planctomycetaceae bacterium]